METTKSNNNADKLFAFIFYIIGYAYVKIQLDWRWAYDAAWKGGWWMTFFVFIYSACVLCYIRAKGAKMPRAGLFWLAVLLCIGVSYAAFTNELLEGVQGLALHITAAYFTLLACGGTLLPHTSDFLAFDLLNALIIVPFANIFARIRSVFTLRPSADKRNVLGAILGVFLLFLDLVFIIPMLSQADSGFDELMSSVFDFSTLTVTETMFNVLLSLPVGAYLFGLAFGGLNKRRVSAFSPKMLENTAKSRHIVPQNTVYIVLGGLAALYVLFIAVQSKSLFSAFSGRLYGTQIYSEYAREGFFSLCRVAVVNAAMLFAADLFAKAPRSESKVLRVFNIAISALTLLLLASAFAKMIMYVGAYGFTQRRILTLWFMAVLAVLFVGIIIWQFVNFSPIRVAACSGAALFCVLTMCNIDALVNNYNSSLPQNDAAYTEVYDAEAAY
ncbi:MAG: DUF4173 domain-containing protein [Ruminococcaceae bacterium]|nr:DUF4173 domain-containing protein [Oscillospiraceae bacterium]